MIARQAVIEMLKVLTTDGLSDTAAAAGAIVIGAAALNLDAERDDLREQLLALRS
jgi:hypothetical protein